MVGPVTDSAIAREASYNQSRPPTAPPVPGAADPSTGLPPYQRVVALQSAVEKLIRNSLPANSRLSIEEDKEAGTYVYRALDNTSGEILRQWPVEEFVRLREALREMEGMLLDVKV